MSMHPYNDPFFLSSIVKTSRIAVLLSRNIDNNNWLKEWLMIYLLIVYRKEYLWWKKYLTRMQLVQV